MTLNALQQEAHLLSARSFSRVQLFVTPLSAALQAPLSMDSPGKNIGMGCHFPLQGIFLTQGSNPSPAFQEDSLPPEPPRKPEIYNSPPLFLVLFSEGFSNPWSSNIKWKIPEVNNSNVLYFIPFCVVWWHLLCPACAAWDVNPTSFCPRYLFIVGKKHYIYRVWYYPWFQAFTEGFGQGGTIEMLFAYVLKVHLCGEGDGTPLQYSCLEYPMDGGAW